MDHMAIIYLVCMFTGLYGMNLFIWEWNRKRPARPSNVFRAVACVMGGIALITGINFVGRLLRHSYGIHIYEGWYWPFRWYPVLFAIIYLNYHLTRKVLGYTDKA